MMEIVNEIVMRPINTIKPYIRNPRKNDKTVEMLVKIIPKVGFNVPLVIDKNGVIVKGHARFNAAIKLGMTELPCVITHADEEAIKADRIADNKISEFSEWIDEELLHEVDMINLDIDFSEFGFPVPTFDDIPSVEDFMENVEDDVQLSEEQRKKLYEEFLQNQEKQQAQEVEITSKKEIEKAIQKQNNSAPEKQEYVKVVCEKCGHIMYVKRDDLV